ncbi:alpha-xylosidase [Alicyclobacillus hesperidum]|uniref:alpha-D-xyloside xylohydrolase n=1 Tax=Alicyclobacillus hesperidum TaxID=89784 RepID=A0AA37UDQ7_9BACL|nr:alpha-xylosidase [Alicyclobacillus hesperidum]GLV14309.1 alpha-xylosidase [Alicyclobacillus hesperidum]
MKFSDGNWLNRKGVSVHSPALVHDAVIEQNAVTLYAPCKPIHHRGATLDGPLLTIRLSSPMHDIIRVQVQHFKGKGDPGPAFQLHEEPCPVQIAETEDTIEMTSGTLKVRVQRNPWSMSFINDRGLLTQSGNKGLAYVIDNGVAHMREQLGLSVGECVYGLGERFTSFVKNGQTVDIWNRDGGTNSEQAYKNVPFYLTNRGYGVFVNHPELVSYEVGSEVVSRVQFSVEGESLDYFIVNGPTPKQVLERYTSLTGKPALPPAWSFGLWLTTSFTTNYDEQTVNQFVDGMAERKIPLRVFHFDCFWMKEFEWCNFEWDRRVFPDPEGMLSRLKAKGLNICVWINPYIAQKSPLFDEAATLGYLLKRPNGDIWQWDLWQAGMGIVDFTNPAACAWFANKLKRLIDMGVDCFKTDFGERIPTDVVYYDGSDPLKMHNYYTHLYNQVVFNTLKQHVGEHDAVVFSRSATAGGQQFPVHWGGDCSATYESMAESLRGGLSLTLSGFGFWSHDIGGFEETSTPDLYKRWTAFGLLSSHSRLHGNASYRVPWIYDEEAVDVLRHFTELKYRLMPYLYAAAKEAARTGIPVMRAMLLEFPDDPACDYLDRQYMLGPSLMVAPVFQEDGFVSYYLPHGTWTHLLTGEVVVGGSWRRERYDYFSLPLFVRENSILPFGSRVDRPDYEFADGVEFHVFQVEEDAVANFTLYGAAGDTAGSLTVERRGGVTELVPDGLAKPWTACLRGGCAQVATVDGGTVEQTELGLRVTPGHPSHSVTIRLQV